MFHAILSAQTNFIPKFFSPKIFVQWAVQPSIPVYPVNFGAVGFVMVEVLGVADVEDFRAGDGGDASLCHGHCAALSLRLGGGFPSRFTGLPAIRDRCASARHLEEIRLHLHHLRKRDRCVICLDNFAMTVCSVFYLQFLRWLTVSSCVIPAAQGRETQKFRVARQHGISCSNSFFCCTVLSQTCYYNAPLLGRNCFGSLSSGN